MGYNNQQQIFSLQLTYPPANCEGLHQFAIKYGSFKNDDFQGKVMDFHSYVSWLTDCKCASSLPLKWSFGGVHHLNHLRVSWNGGAPKASILMFFFSNHYKPTILGSQNDPPFMETPICRYIRIRSTGPISGPKTSAAPASSKLLTHYKTM